MKAPELFFQPKPRQMEAAAKALSEQAACLSCGGKENLAVSIIPFARQPEQVEVVAISFCAHCRETIDEEKLVTIAEDTLREFLTRPVKPCSVVDPAGRVVERTAYSLDPKLCN